MDEVETGSVGESLENEASAMEADAPQATESAETGGDETSQTPATENQTEESTSTTETSGEEVAQEEEAAEPAPEYKPNVKFKVMDKEHEIPPVFHSIMKNAESEKLVRELHEKALGLDVVKPKFVEMRNERNQLAQEKSEIIGSIDEMRNIYQSAVKTGNLHKLDAFFDRLKIPQDVVLQYALAKVQLSELPPEQRHAVVSRLEAEKQAESAVSAQTQIQQQFAQQAAQLKGVMLETGLARSEIRSVSDAFDARVGKPGAFRDEVVRTGEIAWYQSGGKIDLTPDQAIQEVLKRYGLAADGSQAAETAQGQASGTSPGTPTNPSSPGKKAPVTRTDRTIPNVTGRSSSPLKTKPRSIEDLKELYRQSALNG